LIYRAQPTINEKIKGLASFCYSFVAPTLTEYINLVKRLKELCN